VSAETAETSGRWPLTVAEAARQLRSGALTATALVERSLERIHALDGALKACITVMEADARAVAQAADARLSDQRTARAASPLCGIPIGVKDLYQTRGVRTTAGSRVLEDYIPDEDAAAVTRLRAAGAALVAKTNTHEFAWGTFTPPTRNPWDLERIPGGSSGGSAAGIAAGMFLAALGTDTGGSIRIPAACCGVTGLKPTYGLVSRAGVIPLSWSYDHAGPLARSVEDCALLLDELAGYDPADPDSIEAPTLDFVAGLMDRREPAEAMRGARIGVPRQYFFEGVEPEVAALVRTAIDQLQALGADVREVDLPAELNDDLFDSCYRAVQRPEAALFHTERGWASERADRYTAPVRGSIELGAAQLASDYIRGQRIRQAFTAKMRALLSDLDALVMPTLPIIAPHIATLDEPLRLGAREVAVSYATLRNTFPFNLTGQPALALPCGFTSAGLPASLQLAAGHFNEPALLRLGHAYQRVTDWHLRQPTGLVGREAV
jgi:aspartyl-tRNA(Asn)/glutamyl-tRNA(Gln) amidotransferase subunit A